MTDTMITPPPPTDPGTGGGGNWLSQHKGVAIGGGIGLLALIYLYSKSKSTSSASQAGSTPSVYELAPGTQLSGTGSTGGTGQGGGGGGQLSQALEAIEQAISGQSASLAGIQTSISGLQSNSGTGANSGSLPNLDAADFAQIVKPGTYSSSEYTQVGTETAGVYSGEDITGGAPAYGTAFGGLFQGGNINQPGGYTGPIYVPTSLLSYVKGS